MKTVGKAILNILYESPEDFKYQGKPSRICKKENYLLLLLQKYPLSLLQLMIMVNIYTNEQRENLITN